MLWLFQRTKVNLLPVKKRCKWQLFIGGRKYKNKLEQLEMETDGCSNVNSGWIRSRGENLRSTWAADHLPMPIFAGKCWPSSQSTFDLHEVGDLRGLFHYSLWSPCVHIYCNVFFIIQRKYLPSYTFCLPISIIYIINNIKILFIEYPH